MRHFALLARATAMAVICCLLCAQDTPVATAQESATAEEIAVVAAEPARVQSADAAAIPWRYTRFGWQDSSKWYRSTSKIEQTAIEKIHPMLIAANILLAAFGCLIWFSNDREVDRFVGR